MYESAMLTGSSLRPDAHFAFWDLKPFANSRIRQYELLLKQC